MRQLIDLLNSIAGSAARLPSSLPPSSAAGSPGAYVPHSSPNPSPSPSIDTTTSSSMGVRRGSPASAAAALAAAAQPHPLAPPMTAAAAAALPALRAAEKALEAKLADDAAACDRDFLQLHILNERLGLEEPCKDAETRRELNRYCDVLPYDFNRVHLGQVLSSSAAGTAQLAEAAPTQPAAKRGAAAAGAGAAAAAAASNGRPTAAGAAGGQGGGAGAWPADYINASMLKASSKGDIPWAYIAGQGPLRHTRDAFWQMVAEQRCSAIVMLANTVERGVQKCAAYFAPGPRTAKAFGRFTVSTLSAEQLMPDLDRRLLAVKDSQLGSGPMKRSLDGNPQPPQPQQQGSVAAGPLVSPRHHTSVQHYHYTAWPDHGVPPSPEPLLRLCRELRETGAHAAPVLVHCSAGIGRSGVFCVLDIITRRLLHLLEGPAAGPAAAEAAATAVDVAALVVELRRQRLGMVQTRDQFVFCHSALLHFVRCLAAERHCLKAERHPEAQRAQQEGRAEAQQQPQQQPRPQQQQQQGQQPGGRLPRHQQQAEPL